MNSAPRSPTPPTPLDADPGAVTDALGGAAVEVPAALERQLEELGVPVLREPGVLAESGRDWWPLAIGWAARGSVPKRPSAVVRPTSTQQVAQILPRCAAAGVPVTPAAGRSGVCGGAVPIHGGLVLDLTSLCGVVDVDELSLTVDVRAGTFGPDLESELADWGPGYTAGHWPQSMDLSTVGGWLACRGAGQYSTRYGKIEDISAGVQVVLADGTVVDTRHEAPRSATGPSLTQLFLGSEGTLGVITEARLRIHPRPEHQARRAFGFQTFAQGLEACRRILRRGATPAVLRLYDAAESQRNFDHQGDCVLIVLDECDHHLLEATMAVVDEVVASSERLGEMRRLDDGLVEHWLEHRNDVSALAPLWRAGIVVDTAEVAGPWRVLPALAHQVPQALQGVEGTLMASVHQSHAYSDGACLYFTFAGRAPEGQGSAEPAEWEERYYRAAWDALTRVITAHGAVISHHHGIGINRGRFLEEALGSGLNVLRATKAALDPRGILNPGTLGLGSPFGEVPWP